MFAARQVGALALVLALASPGLADDPPPRIAFAPALGVEQVYRVEYRVQAVERATVADVVGVRFLLAITPAERLGDGYRYDFVVSEVERTVGGRNMDMVVAAALITDGDPFAMGVNPRGFATEVEDFAAVRRRLEQRADALPDPMTSAIARSVIDSHDAEQLTSRITPAFSLMGLMLSYARLAEESGGTAVNWFGSPFEMTRRRDGETGGLLLTFAAEDRADGTPTGPRSSEGRAVILANGQVVSLTHVLARGSERSHTLYATTIEAIPAAP